MAFSLINDSLVLDDAHYGLCILKHGIYCSYKKNLFSLHSMHGSSAESAACSFHLSSVWCIEAF